MINPEIKAKQSAAGETNGLALYGDHNRRMRAAPELIMPAQMARAPPKVKTLAAAY
jgi:hypothetical protein